MPSSDRPCVLASFIIFLLTILFCQTGLMKTIKELDQDDELNQSVEQSGGDTRCNQVFAYRLEEH